MKKLFALNLSDVVFIILINVKMKKKCWHLSINEQDKFRAQLSLAWNGFITSGQHSRET